jgi:hypothetical protein
MVNEGIQTGDRALVQRGSDVSDGEPIETMCAENLIIFSTHSC